MRMPRRIALTVGLLLIVTSGCNDDRRLVEQAERAMARQEEQNQTIARQSQAVIEEGQRLTAAAQALVEHDAQARQELLAAQAELQGQLQAERTELLAQFTALDEERKSLEALRRRESLLVAALQAAASLLLVGLPLWVCAQALRCEAAAPVEQAVLLECLLLEGQPPRGELPALPGPRAETPAVLNQSPQPREDG